MAWEDKGRAVWHQGSCGDDADPHDGSDHAHRNVWVICGLACLFNIDGGTTLGGPTDLKSNNATATNNTDKQIRRAVLGIEPGTSRTLSANHTTRPNGQLMVLSCPV